MGNVGEMQTLFPIKGKGWLSNQVLLSAALIGGILLSYLTPALAQEMRTVTDPETGCVYFIYGSSLTPRLRRDGLPDCPDSGRRPRPDVPANPTDRSSTKGGRSDRG